MKMNRCVRCMKEVELNLETGDFFCPDCGHDQRKNQSKRGIITVISAIVLIALAVLIGLSIYNAPENRLARALALGQKYLLEENYEQAIVEFNKVIEIEPVNVDAYLGLADAYVGMGNTDEAIATLEKGYELTENEEILKKLEGLRGDTREPAEVTENAEELQEENELPYYELGFSPEDFKIAGYSIVDGTFDDVKDGIIQAAAAIMPDTPPQEGWHFEYFDGGVTIFYRPAYAANGDHYGVLSVYSNEGTDLRFGIGYALFYDLDDGQFPSSIPLYEGKVIPCLTSYEETLDILGVREAGQMLKETDEYFYFESQYGETYVDLHDYEYHSGGEMHMTDGKELAIHTDEWVIGLVFDVNNILKDMFLIKSS